MTDIETLVRDNVRKLIPYSCARDEFKGKEGTFLDANENPYGRLNRYPDPYHQELRRAISKYKKVPFENIFLGNGSDEVIDLCFRIFCNPGTDKALTVYPSYGMYEVSSAVNDISIIKVPLNNEFQIDTDKVIRTIALDNSIKLIFLCSPNNPTGNCLNHADIEKITANFRGIVVLDEAYADFSRKPSFTQNIDKYPNLIVMQTFSKAFGLAAARIGMAFADEKIINYFYRIKPPYNISTLNQEAALKKLSDTDAVNKDIENILAERERLKEKLETLDAVEKIFPSDANFLLVRVKDADYIYNSLISNKIIVRNRTKLVFNCLRITVGTPDENDELLKALKMIVL
ncbi:MAG: histidinol-phosphate transaminase [Bacteroidales bacterium]|nr:histidinol-phosphate transaminase [Bacteroidales bacterium]